jgi:hypothetical protein
MLHLLAAKTSEKSAKNCQSKQEALPASKLKSTINNRQFNVE